MEISKKNLNGTLTIAVKGSLDATNSAEFDAGVAEDIKGATKVVLDLEELDYISSAGLRCILKIKKTVNDTTIINAQPAVFDIFSMTGFAEMIKVSRALRKLSVEGCKIIGKGAIGTVYRISPDTIVKVFREGSTMEDVDRERGMAKKAFVKGVPTAIPYDVVKVGNQLGSVFELLDAKDMCTVIREDIANMDKYIEQYASVVQAIHGSVMEPGEFPSKKAELVGWAEYLEGKIDAEDWKKLIALCKGLREDDHMLHGDLHIKNIMVQKGEPFIIDMDTLSLGQRVLEYGFMYSCYCGYGELDKNNAIIFFGIAQDQLEYIFKKTIEICNAGKSEDEIALIIKKARIISYTQLLQRFIRENDRPQLVERFKGEMKELLAEVDDLNIE